MPSPSSEVISLACAAGALAADASAQGGSLVFSIDWHGPTIAAPDSFTATPITEGDLLTQLKKHFKSVAHVKPPASRAGSVELYVLAKDFRG